MTRAIERTRCWVRDVVIGLNLCPFARVPFEADTIRYQTCKADDNDAIYAALIEEIALFAQLPPDQAETALFIVPDGLQDFADYLDVLEDAQAAIEEAGLDAMLQLASFHPDYCFEGLEMDDPANYTNRSPFPMFHLIRQDGLAAALESYPEPESIPRRNIELLRKLGPQNIQRLLAACESPSSGKG